MIREKNKKKTCNPQGEDSSRIPPDTGNLFSQPPDLQTDDHASREILGNLDNLDDDDDDGQ